MHYTKPPEVNSVWPNHGPPT